MEDPARARPAVIVAARQARGLKQAELARRAGISQGFLSKVEADLAPLYGEKLANVAAALDVTPELLCSDAELASATSCLFHRKRNALPVAIATSVHGQTDLIRLQLAILLEDGDLPPLLLGRDEPGDLDSPVDIARRVRLKLGVPAGPIDDIVGLLESAGALVVDVDFGSRHIDAVCQWPEGERPLILLNIEAPPDRQRFTVAHELGHAVMHIATSEDQEQQADEFASEFLLPAADVRGELVGLSLPRLMELRLRWGVSMAALVRRAYDLDLLTAYQYKTLNIDLARAGFKTRSPEGVSMERPRLVGRAIETLREAGLSGLEIADRVGTTPQGLEMIFAGVSI